MEFLILAWPKLLLCSIIPQTRAVLTPVTFQNSLLSFVFYWAARSLFLNYSQGCLHCTAMKGWPTEPVPLVAARVCLWSRGSTTMVIHQSVFIIYPQASTHQPIPAHQLSRVEQGNSWCFKPASKPPHHS